MRLAQEELRIATFAVARIATKTKHILHELTGFVHEYLQETFKAPKNHAGLPRHSPGGQYYLEKQTTYCNFR
jgi:hypothetical protein